MNTQTQVTILLVVIGFLVGGIAGYCVNNWNDREYQTFGHGMGMMYDDDTYRDRDGVREGYGWMMDNEETLAGGHMMHDMVVSSEQEFLEEMIPHHQEAVDTAKEVLARGAATPEVKSLVEGIVTAQEKEIADMKQWYQDWYGKEYQETGEYQPMMRDLENYSGEELDRVFLQDMIMHHMGAIMMARSVQSYIEHQEIADLTSGIVETQTKEIYTMRQLLQ